MDIKAVKKIEYVNHIRKEIRLLKEYKDSDELSSFLSKQGGNRYRNGMTYNSRYMAMRQFIEILEFNITEYIATPSRDSYKTINKLLKHAKNNNAIVRRAVQKYKLK